MNMPTRDPEPSWNPAYNQNPSHLDGDLVTRSSLVCGGGKLSKDEYNLGLHVMALFVILAQSTLACAFPLIAKKFPSLRIPPQFLFYARHFGTGVLIATAFVHLLPTAFSSLTNSCLPPLWNEDYPAMAGCIAMVAVFFVTIVEMLFARGGHVCGQYAEGGREAGLESEMEAGMRKKRRWGKGKLGHRNLKKPGSPAEDMVGNDDSSEEIGGTGGVGKIGFGMAGRRRSRSLSVGQGLRRIEELQRIRDGGYPNNGTNNAIVEADDDEIRVDRSPSSTGSNSPERGSDLEAYELDDKEEKEIKFTEDDSVAKTKVELTPAQKYKKALLQVVLLEMGILFHSVFIGMALSVTGNPDFIVLLIAIIFHQTFEGLALGSRIAVLSWAPGALQPWLMALAYGLTTPVGQAIGLATHTLYSPQSQTGLLMVGIMNAISSGLLVFAGLVELLAEDFLSDESWRALRGSKRIIAFVCVALGAMGMAIVGAWA